MTGGKGIWGDVTMVGRIVSAGTTPGNARTPENPMKLEDIEMKISNLLSKVQLAPSVRDIGDAIENITQDGEIRRLVS